MDINALIDTIASEADTFLDGVTSRTEARVAINEHLAEAYPRVPENNRKPIVDGVMSILEDEDFFSALRTDGVEDAAEDGGTDE